MENRYQVAERERAEKAKRDAEAATKKEQVDREKQERVARGEKPADEKTKNPEKSDARASSGRDGSGRRKAKTKVPGPDEVSGPFVDNIPDDEVDAAAKNDAHSAALKAEVDAKLARSEEECPPASDRLTRLYSDREDKWSRDEETAKAEKKKPGVRSSRDGQVEGEPERSTPTEDFIIKLTRVGIHAEAVSEPIRPELLVDQTTAAKVVNDLYKELQQMY